MQTLPVRKTNIVHAKFLSNLLLCGFIFIWTSVLVSANLLMNDVWTIGSWMIVFPFLAVLMLLVSGNLLWYYFQGSLHNGWINYALVIGGTMILLYLGFHKPSGQSQTFLYSLSLSLSVLVYFVNWVAVIIKVHKKGFAKEVPNPEREKTNKRIEELKRRHAEHQSKKNQQGNEP
ncbi:hypothetical protein FFL34_15620 [Lentibacillus cibarius]|uniref:Uncharacterized protein n=1 Tax=Lentibacillus cibarius TaxID=2583219 RepID=A0A5S3QN41_9BACI|nr:hypothetical protein FFL34_15620 [Lentibacillus cibarius]